MMGDRRRAWSGDVLIVAAFGAEANHFPADLEVLVTGVGKTAAAVAVAAELARREASGLDVACVVNVGTCGALRDEVSGIVLPSFVVNHDINADVIRALGIDPDDELTIDGGDGTVLASGDTFVNDPVTRQRLAQRAHVVDMEGYGVVLACQRAGVPVRIVKHVSDAADEAAMDWPQLVDVSARALGAWLAAELPP